MSNKKQGIEDNMRSIRMNVYGLALTLATICTGLHIYNMVAIIIFREQVFLEQGIISSGGEMTILIGFIAVVSFTFVSLVWMFLRIRQPHVVKRGDVYIFSLGVFCLILLIGEKVLVDEISHEYSLRWEAMGEWIFLYVCLMIQLIYNIIIVRKLYLVNKAQRSVQVA